MDDPFNVFEVMGHDPSDPAPDFRGADRIVDGICSEDVDMGAIEFQPDKLEPCPADLDGDGEVDGADLGILLSEWDQSGCVDCSNCLGDLTGDCVVNGADLGTLLSEWGRCPATDCECEGGSEGGGTLTGGGSTTSGGGDNVYYEWLLTATFQEIIDWLDMMGYWPE